VAQPLVGSQLRPETHGFALSARLLAIPWPTNFPGYILQQNMNLRATNWTAAAETVSAVGPKYQAVILTTNDARFFPLSHP
jgi:hypothetical protein